ncbi:hypothetical protein G6F61_010078 [Rhizopus arrhizus]|nr:hypothetical protein G6F61_010078 [Rhizopus arrhizus]
MSKKFNLLQTLACIACGGVLIDPITLSCGYTICVHCFPISSPSSIKKSVFKCPAPHCDAETHLFGPELSQDATITQLTHILHQSVTLEETDNKQIDPAMIVPLLNCLSCHHSISDPITTPCGHTFCRACVLRSKIENNACSFCCRPLPKYSNLVSQSPNHTLSRLVKELQLLGSLPSHDNDFIHQTNVPLFISDQVIFPGQHTQLLIHTHFQMTMLKESIMTCGQYHSPCLASIHRSQPHVAKFGTLLQIMNTQRQNGALVIDVVGMNRFRLKSYQDKESRLMADFEILDESSLVPLSIECAGSEDALIQHTYITEYAIELANTISQHIQYLAQPSSIPSHLLHAQTAGLLGPLWLESMVSLHGPMPPRENPAAVCWWTATVLPIPISDAYELLRTISLVDRLELVISWLQSYQSQWTQCRERAIYAYLQVPQ